MHIVLLSQLCTLTIGRGQFRVLSNVFHFVHCTFNIVLYMYAYVLNGTGGKQVYEYQIRAVVIEIEVVRFNKGLALSC